MSFITDTGGLLGVLGQIFLPTLVPWMAEAALPVAMLKVDASFRLAFDIYEEQSYIPMSNFAWVNSVERLSYGNNVVDDARASLQAQYGQQVGGYGNRGQSFSGDAPSYNITIDGILLSNNPMSDPASSSFTPNTTALYAPMDDTLFTSKGPSVGDSLTPQLSCEMCPTANPIANTSTAIMSDKGEMWTVAMASSENLRV